MFYTYAITPIDFGWEFLPTVNAMRLHLAARHNDNFETPELEGFEKAWKEAQIAAKGAGWEGDFRHDPVVFFVPEENDFGWGFVIKQDNNGDTFVMSPHLLPHLTDL